MQMKKRKMKIGEALVGMKRRGSQLEGTLALVLYLKLMRRHVPPEAEHLCVADMVVCPVLSRLSSAEVACSIVEVGRVPQECGKTVGNKMALINVLYRSMLDSNSCGDGEFVIPFKALGVSGQEQDNQGG